MPKERTNTKDVSGLVNPLRFVRQDGREFEFQTKIIEEVYTTRVFDYKTGQFIDKFTHRCSSSSAVRDYIDETLKVLLRYK